METETSFVSPLLSKDAVKYITQNIDDEEVQYVQDVKSVYDNAKLSGCDEKECEDILYVTKIIAFHEKFRVLHWAAKTMSYHNELDKFCDVIGGYKDAIAENIQSIIGQFKGNEFQSIVLPIANDPLDVIDQLRQTVESWMELHTEDVAYEGCRNATSGFYESIRKYIYIFRICDES